MKRLYLTSVSALLLLTGCEQLQSLLDRQISVPDTSQLIQTVSAESTEGETTIDFITQDAWQAAISQPGEERIPEWLSVSPESGDEGGTYSMHIALLPNENNSDRTALITITCGKDEVQARITQKATDDSGNGTGDEDEDEDEDEDSLIFADGTPQTLTLPAAGSEIDLAFSASGPWQAEITDGVEWIVLSQAAGEAGEHSLTVTVAENAAPVQRAAEITFTCGTSAVTILITQQATETITFPDGTPQTLTLPEAGGEIDLTFSASGPWQAEITDGVEWIVLSQAAGKAGEHSLTVTVAENAAPVQRAAEITFTCGTSAVTILITQQATETITFPDGTPQTLTLPAAGGEIDLAFSASGPWQAEITDGVEWIVLSQAAGEAGEHSLTVTVAENAAPVQRAAEITFTCGISAVTFSITQQTAEI